jgi:hypothetical protein
MPFLHWDYNADRCEREDAMTKKNHSANSDEQKLIKDDFNTNHPISLHPRRTLDRFYYHTLDSTSKRDESQVITRFQDKLQLNRLQHIHSGPESEQRISRKEFQNDQKTDKILCMVDQLWLWVLRGHDNQGDTVISCFPGVEKKKREPSSESNDKTEVLAGLERDLQSSDVQDADHLAKLIVNRCCRNFLDSNTTLSFGTEHQILFSDVYEGAIEEIVSYSFSRHLSFFWRKG